MNNGAYSVHKQLREELENYIKSQYFGKTPLLLDTISSHIDDEGLLYQKPYIESSPAYKSINNGISEAKIPEWMRGFFISLSDAGLNVYKSPFVHQIKALEAAVSGKDLFVSTGTGSGKTECFMWPLLAKMASEAKNNPETWEKRGVRTIIMYPMNALVSDQVVRLRRLIGDQEKRFIQIFRNECGKESRRPQFGMYTGRTPYPGSEPRRKEDHQLVQTLSRLSFPKTDNEKKYFQQLLEEGRIPAKENMEEFLEGLNDGKHIPNPEDAELITRFEMQQFTPDILITNYSMLEYMLLRPREGKIWRNTKEWLESNEENKLLYIIDEAHMYRGSSGGEVALLIRRLFHKLGIKRDRVQFILTTASMPDATEEDRNAVKLFANELTASDEQREFCYLTGEREEIAGHQKYDIPFSFLSSVDPSDFENDEESRLTSLNNFWSKVEGKPSVFTSPDEAYLWLYEHIIDYRPFAELIRMCRGSAISLDELSNTIFPNEIKEEALNAISVLLAIAPLARNKKGAVLFPARMHMLFKGLKGVYACSNPNCSHSHSDESLSLGEIFISEEHLNCPYCNSVVYELYNDRRCGALFYKGYILEDDANGGFNGNVFLWHYPGQYFDRKLKEIHLFIPEKGFELSKKNSKNPVLPCYLDINSGFINFNDDSQADNPNMRKLYYCNYSAPGIPQVLTFPSCPHCQHQMSTAQLSSFNTRGNQSFFNLIKSQFQVQPPVPGKDNDPDRLPNQGRKVLLFSDSRQRAAKLARDMSEASDIMAARQLMMLAIRDMEKKGNNSSFNSVYDYFCIAAANHHSHIFHEPEREKFASDCETATSNLRRSEKRGMEYIPRFNIENAPNQMKQFLLQLFCGAYNTLWDSASSWIEPTNQALFDAVDILEESGITVTDEEFLELFNAWIISVCDTGTALGHTIPDAIRLNVRPRYSGYGLDKDWKFTKNIIDIMGWNEDDALKWKRVLKESFLDVSSDNSDKYYVDLSRIKPRFDPEHAWYRCEKCSELTPYMLKMRCPSCGAQSLHKVNEKEYEALSFWRKPIDDALDGGAIHIIDTEEHTAQLSHKDQRDNMWSKTEEYELRFQDLIQEGESPVDILSSTTTMEVGIDIGSLVAVGLRNIPPMRENYQQRAGRAGRRGASLSTIVTFCEDGPHDTLYFNNPVPMFRGDPRRPWIDITSEKLLQRHFTMVILQEYLAANDSSIDEMPAYVFLDEHIEDFINYAQSYSVDDGDLLIPLNCTFDRKNHISILTEELKKLKEKRDSHPELFGLDDNGNTDDLKSLLDSLYEEGIVPTYSFPKNVVSTYICNSYGKTQYEVDRGLDVAIGEYAPGRSIVVDKQTYQIGGLYYPGSERKQGLATSPARNYIDDPNYLKRVMTCHECGWFGLADDNMQTCPFCGNTSIEETVPMLRPWGFAPKNARAIPNAQLSEEYSAVQPPLYSTLPDSDDIKNVPGYKRIRVASRTNQRIIMMNKGVSSMGFMVCEDCGAAMPGNTDAVLKELSRPYITKLAKGRCQHPNALNVNLGYDFVTDMMVLEFALDDTVVDTRRNGNPWLPRAAQSLAEALRLAASKELDIEFSELVTGYRLRTTQNESYVDIYLYDSLSSGAGYAAAVANEIDKLLVSVKDILKNCSCTCSCYKCIKHYRNQYVHGMLDRFAALQLLNWGRDSSIESSFSNEEQKELLSPLIYILEKSGYHMGFEMGTITIQRNGLAKTIGVYPSMWAEPKGKNTIYLSDALLKYAKPYAVQKIFDELK